MSKYVKQTFPTPLRRLLRRMQSQLMRGWSGKRGKDSNTGSAVFCAFVWISHLEICWVSMWDDEHIWGFIEDIEACQTVCTKQICYYMFVTYVSLFKIGTCLSACAQISQCFPGDCAKSHAAVCFHHLVSIVTTVRRLLPADRLYHLLLQFFGSLGCWWFTMFYHFTPLFPSHIIPDKLV